MGPWSPTGQSCGLQPDAHGKAAWPGDGCPCSPELSAEAVPAIPQVTVLSHEFLVVWVKFNAPWPQGTGHSCGTQAGPPAPSHSAAATVNTASPWKPPGQTTPCIQRCPFWDLSGCAGPLPGPFGWADPGSASVPRAAPIAVGFGGGGGPEPVEWAPRRPRGKAGSGTGLWGMSPPHLCGAPHLRIAPHLREPWLRRGACGASRRACARSTQLGRARPGLRAGDLALPAPELDPRPG